MLEHHTHLLAVEVNIHLFLFALLVDEGFSGDVDVVEDDLTVGGLFHQVEAPQEGGLAGTGRTDHDHNIAFVDIDAYIVQSFDLAVVKMLLQVLYLDQISACHRGSSSFRNMRSAWKWGSTGRNKLLLPPAEAP